MELGRKHKLLEFQKLSFQLLAQDHFLIPHFSIYNVHRMQTIWKELKEHMLSQGSKLISWQQLKSFEEMKLSEGNSQ